MKTKGYIALFLITAFTGLQGISFAQEGGFMMPDNNEESNTVETTRGENTRATYTIDPAPKKTDPTSTKKVVEDKRQLEEEDASDSKSEVQPNPKQPSANPDNSSKKPEETEDSVLSFNILYYMIQKFKFSDVIDQ